MPVAAGKPWPTAGRELVLDEQNSDWGNILTGLFTGPLWPDLNFSAINFATEAFGSMIVAVGSTEAV